MYEVHVGLPGVSGVNWCSCLGHLGGSKGRSYVMVANIRFGAEQNSYYGVFSDFKLIYLQVVAAGASFSVGRFWFQKCVPRGGYRAQIWKELRVGAFIKCASRLICRDLRLFGGKMVELEIFGTFEV